MIIDIALCLCFAIIALVQGQQNQALIPPSFNIAQGKKITATSTCGDEGKVEMYCKLTGNTGDSFRRAEQDIVNGQYCDICDMSRPLLKHPAEYAIDGTEKWWQSPPLSRGLSYNEVNITIDLGQSYHVAYILMKFANSPRPGVWILEKSTDFGNTYEPWQYFADSDSDCWENFGMVSTEELTSDDQVICTTAYSDIVPLEDGEIVVFLINGRPGSKDFYASDELQDFTRATNVRLRLKKTNTLHGHLMAKQQQDPTVTRRYYYSIKDISIGGRCLCNGHADRCDTPIPGQVGRIMCTCSHNTCGSECQECCPGFVQKKWLPATPQTANECEPCNCFKHATSCYYDEDVDHREESLDIYGNYSGGGVCIDCKDNTTGINCNECKPGYYRVRNTPLTSPSICQSCICQSEFHTGNCASLTGQCECKPQFTGDTCSECSLGYYGYPECKECRCNVNGTINAECQARGGQCPCKRNFRGIKCDKCAPTYYNFPYCLPCECSIYGQLDALCEAGTGQCRCHVSYRGRACDECAQGFYGYPNCVDCNCHSEGTEGAVCDTNQGRCRCKDNFAGVYCDQCASGYFDFPNCNPCNCNSIGTGNVLQCYGNGQCLCLPNYSGIKCDSCSPEFYRYPECIACECDQQGSVQLNCDQVTGQCDCYRNFIGRDCKQCALGFYNFPSCEECNCAPAGVQEQLQGQPIGGCGAETNGACICKDHVTGRSCDECKELYWNLQLTNTNGCEECNCYTPGTISTSQVCKTVSGQCRCKMLVTGRQCTECQDQSYELTGSNVFGCSACDCDVGGAIDTLCHKSTGKCTCRPRIRGKRCDEPARAHFFYDLYQFRFEIEEGRSTSGGRVRIGYDESVFSHFSYLGYAIMSESTQPSVIVTLDVVAHVLYRIILCYVHIGTDVIRGSIKLSPSHPSIGSEQVHPVLFLPGAGPQLVTVEGGNIISPFVLNPGRWFATIEATGGLLLDYLVLLPAAYYEASRLKQQVAEPCQAGQTQDLCNFFVYPNIEQYHIVLGQAGYYYTDDGAIREPTQLFTNQTILQDLSVPEMAFLDVLQPMLSLSFPITVAGEYVLIVEFYRGGIGMSEHTVEVITEQGKDNGFVATYDCYFLCRSVVMDAASRVKVFVFPEEVFEIKFTKHQSLNTMALSSIVAVPVEKWNFDLVTPTLQCVRDSNKNCVRSTYPDAGSSIKFDVANTDGSTSPIPPNIYNTNTKLYYMNTDLGKVELLLDDITLADEQWVFIVHYYQPHHSAYTVYFDIVDESQSGSFEAKYCPHVVGCRALVMTTDSSNTFTWLGGDYNIKITLQATDSYDIWIDYILAVPKDVYTPELLELTKQDRASDFIRECSNQEFYISPSATGFCRDSVFSLSVSYNNGAESCNCNIHGSTSYFCNQLGGQCPCRERSTGRRCDRCKIGFYNFPDCQRCTCLSGICNDLTGVCICPPKVIGNSCDTCQENYFGYDPIAGCIECDCDPRGTDGDINKCDRVSGQCSCKPNVGGRRCDQCLPGHHSYPFCHVCNCQLPGTVERVCDEVSAQCLCKENVHGEFCDQCDNSTFYLEERNPKGCTSCFCFGITDDCVASSNLYRQQVNNMIGWNVTNIRNSDVFLRDNEVSVYVRGTGDDPLATIYWVAPTEYLGNKITSYGGKLRYIVSYRANTLNPANPIRRPDVILSGSSLEIMYSNIYKPNRERQEVELDILESNFQYTLGGGQVTREDLIMVLADLRMLQIRAQYHISMEYSSLMNVSLDIAAYQGVEKVLTVEDCNCPIGYIGLSCQECADGYHRSGVGLFLGSCIPCECNGHSDQCDKQTGECIYCKHNTDGSSCGSCKPGYYEDSNQNYPFACQLCACPRSIEGSSFAYSCSVSGIVTTCDCLPGYHGTTCRECEDDYYGSPEVVGGDCQPCFCHGNTDPNAVGRRCDRLTGECFCADGYSGFNCNRCTDGYYGDAVNQHNCQKCQCNTCGVSRCDNTTGSCTCQPNIVGSSCNRCRSGTWGFSSCQGCQSCDCGVAAVMPDCIVETGECICLPGVGGDKCTHCLRGFWNYGPTGCIECSCPDLHECEPVTGDCLCPVGATGEDCDTCEDRYILTQEGCKPCDRCVHQLLDAMHSMILDVNMTTPGEIPLGQADLDRLDELNDTLWNELKPEVSEVLVNNMLLEVQLANMTAELKRTSTRANEVETLSVKIKDSAENEHLPAAFNVKQRANDLETFINQSYASLQHMIMMSKNRNITEEQDGLQESMAEARRIVNEIESKNFTEAEKASRKEYLAAQILLHNVTHLNQDVQGFLTYLMNVSSHFERVENDINDLIGWSHDANRSVSESKKINGDNIISKGNLEVDIHLSNLLFANGTRKIEDSNELLALARSYLIDAYASNANLTEDYTRLVAGIARFAPVVKTLMEDLEGTEELVDQAGQHAKNLTAYAAKLVELSNTGIEYAELADQAAKAYSDIVDAIENAEISANDSLAAAEIAKQQSDDLRAEKVLKKSKRKLDEAEEAKRKHDEELVPKMKRVETVMQELSNTNSQVNYHLQMLKNGINDLPEVDSEEARIAFNLSTQAEQVANENKNIIDTVNTKIPLTEPLLKDIQTNINLSTKALDDAEEKITKSYKYLSSIEPLAKKISDTADTIDNDRSTIEYDINTIKEKVRDARGAAHRIRIATSFTNRTAYSKVRPLNDMAKPASHSSFTFSMNDTSDGLLFFIGGPTKQDEFMAAEIENSKLKVAYRLSSSVNPAVAISNFNVPKNDWSEVSILRVGTAVDIEVEKAGALSEQFASDASILNLANGAVFYIGGVPNSYKGLPDIINRKSLEGSIQSFAYDHEYISLWNFEEESGINGSRGLEKRPNKNEATFTDKTYVLFEFDSFSLSSGVSFQIVLKFTSYSQNALLFYIGDQDMFIAVSIRDGKVVMQCGSQLGIIEVESKEKQNNGMPKLVRASLSVTQATLKIGYVTESITTAIADFHLEKQYFIGGVRNPEDVSHSNVTTEGFIGCISDVSIIGQSVNFALDTVMAHGEGLNIGCKDKEIYQLSLLEPGYVEMPLQPQLAGEFSLMLSFRTIKSNGTLFTIASNEIIYLTAKIKDGDLVVEGVLGSEMYRRSANQNVSDGNWHVVSLMKTAKKLTLLLDDVTYDMVEEADDWFVQFGSKILIGNYANSEPFIGCIADLIINKEVQPFNKEIGYSNAEFGVCRLDSIVGIPEVIPPPSIVDQQDSATTVPQDSATTVPQDSATTVPQDSATTVPQDSATTVPPESCALLPPDNNGMTEDGFQFGNNNSRIELNDMSVFKGEFRKSGSIKMSIKTESEDGILYYAAGLRRDFLSVYLASGKVVFTFDCGAGAVIVRGDTFVNDGIWHKIEAYRYQNKGNLTVDETWSEDTLGDKKDINKISAPQYIGGGPQNIPETRVPLSSQIGFVGCLKDFSTVVKKNAIALVDQHPVKFDVAPCGAEQGIFVQNGYLVLSEEEKVGKMFDVEFDMKPRVTEGVLMSVRTGKYFFVVEMVEGTVVARASNGEVPFEASSSQLGTSICDGQWHNVTVEKKRSTIKLTVDGNVTERKLHGAQEKNARTTDALYVGGIPDNEPVDHTSSKKQFVGCLKNIKINGETMIVTGKQSSGNVSIDSCPVG